MKSQGDDDHKEMTITMSGEESLTPYVLIVPTRPESHVLRWQCLGWTKDKG